MKKRTVSVLLTIVIIVSVFILIKLIYERSILEKEVVKSNFCHTVDLLDDKFEEYKGRASILQDLNKMNEMLHNAESFEFIEVKVGACYVSKDSYKGNINNSYDEEDFNYSNELRKVKSIQISDNAPDFFEMVVANGEYFNDSDFMYKENNINIILGSSYAEIYNIGETIEMVVNGQKLIGKVKGFLAPEANVIYFNQRIVLDNFIIIPQEEVCIDENKDFMHAFTVLLDKNNGVVVPIESETKVEGELSDMCTKVELPYTLSIKGNEIFRVNTIKIIVVSLGILMTGTILFKMRRINRAKSND